MNVEEPFEMVFAKKCHALERENALLKLGVNELLNKQIMELAIENSALRKANADLRARVDGMAETISNLESAILAAKNKKWGRTFKPKRIITKGRVTR